MDASLQYRYVKPEGKLACFVESLWMLQNPTDSEKEAVVVPDGRIDLSISQSANRPFGIVLMGLETQAKQVCIPPKTNMMAISFNLLATEYILHETIAGLVDENRQLPSGFWGLEEADLQDFDQFCQKASQQILALLPKEIDERKHQLFDLVYATNGAISVEELAKQVFWSSRQINRYFNQQYGISLKTYCNILRFRASFQQIKESKLFPEQNFADQSHFIKEIKRLSGVSPKQLNRNQNDRFIQLSLLPKGYLWS